MKKISVFILFFLGLCILSGCPSTEEKELQIGALYPRSGSLALLGEESWRGAEIARLERNKQGGIAGRQIEFVEGDCHDVAAARQQPG